MHVANARMATIVFLAAASAAAFDPYEIQIYDGTSDAPGHAGLEIHLNRHHDATHLTFEPSFGLTSFWEIGGYLQTQQGHYEGVKLRSKFVTPEGLLGDFRLGINFEVADEPGGTWAGEIRPIFAFENQRFLLAMNPNLSFPAAFEPGAMAKVKFGHVAAGVEYYGTLGPQHEQYVFAAADLIAFKDFELNLGFGGGSALAGKMIAGYVF